MWKINWLILLEFELASCCVQLFAPVLNCINRVQHFDNDAHLHPLWVLTLAAAQIFWCQSHAEFVPDNILGQTAAHLLGQEHASLYETPPYYQLYALHDTSNDEISRANTQAIIERSGYRFENHYGLG